MSSKAAAPMWPGTADSLVRRPYGRGSKGVPPWCPRAVNNQQPPTAAPCEPQRRWRPDSGSNAPDTLVMRRSLVSDEDLGAEAPTALRGALLKSAEAYH